MPINLKALSYTINDFILCSLADEALYVKGKGSENRLWPQRQSQLRSKSN